MVHARLKKILFMILIAVAPAVAGGSSWAVYTGEERFTIYVGIYKPIIWSFRESDGADDESTPFENEGEYKFDLKEIVEAKGFPTGVSASVNFFGVVEPRISYEWFSFKYDDYGLAFNGSPVARKDYALDVMVGYDINRINPKQVAGLIYQLYPYGYVGLGYTDYTEKLTVAGLTREGNIILADASHINLGVGLRYGLAKLVNVGAEVGIKIRDFKTEEPPQPSGIAGEGYLRLTFAAAYGR